MKTVYVFFIATEFKIGKAIRLATHNRYNHVALSFEPTARELYSYSRYRYYEPLLSGFGIEYTDRYRTTADAVKVRVCEYRVSDELYARIKERIALYTEKKSETQYNFFDVLLYPFNRHIGISYVHTCISFLLELLELLQIHTIAQLEELLKDDIIFEGLLKEFDPIETSGPVDFFEKRDRRTRYGELGAKIRCLMMGFARRRRA